MDKYSSPCCLASVNFDEFTGMWVCSVCGEGFNEDELINDENDERDITESEIAEMGKI